MFKGAKTAAAGSPVGSPKVARAKDAPAGQAPPAINPGQAGLRKSVAQPAGGAAPAKAPGFNTLRSGLKKQGQAAAGGDEPQWLRVQKAIYGRFVEQRLLLGGTRVEINDVLADLADGQLLVKLLEALSGEKYPLAAKLASGLQRIQMVNQVSEVMKWLDTLKVDKKGCSPEDLIDKKDKSVFGMLFSIILKYVKLDDEEEGGSGDVREALKLWFQRRTQGYKGVEIKDFKTSFHDGLALCALIHKMRPKLIPFDTLSGGKDHAIANLKLALSVGNEYCNVPDILFPEDISTLDEISMTVYLFDWYYGVAMLQKQDVAARRLGKLITMTKLHDKMKADYIASADQTSQWIDAKIAHLTGITFTNTLAGIKQQIAELNAYKSGEKAVQVAKNLDNDALFNNLAVRLRQANRPEFTPVNSPAVLEKKLEALDKTERETSVRLIKELAHQLELDQLNTRFNDDEAKLRAWIATEKSYTLQEENAVLTEVANANLYTASLHEKDIKNAKVTRLNDLAELSKRLQNANYEKKDAVAAKLKGSEEEFAGLEHSFQEKQKKLQAALKSNQEADDRACKHFASLCENFAAWIAEQKKTMQAASQGVELEAQLVALDHQVAAVKAETDKIGAIKEAQAAIDARHIFANPHTSNSVADAEAGVAQLSLLLSKKRELLVARIDEKNKAGLTADQVKEIADNFNFFDKNKSGFLDKKELRNCLASLGEDSTPKDVEAIMNEYDANKNGKISADEFSVFMKKRMGDTNTEEEINQGWGYITIGEAVVTKKQIEVLVNDLSWKQEHVHYLTSEQTDVPFPEPGLDHAAWTAAVFKR